MTGLAHQLTVGSLFSGVGGLDLGLERAGMRVTWQSEIDPYCCRILARHWPDVPNLGDVTTIDWAEVPRVDLICGGYPCQPFSQAGRRLGEADPRHLWPWMLDAIRVLRPRWALLENVAGHLALGFGRVLGDLAEIGYDAEWDCIPAAAVGAPHRRDRVFIVAYPQRNELRQQSRRRNGESGPCPTLVGDDGPQEPVADPARRGEPDQQESNRTRLALGAIIGAGDRVGSRDSAAGTVIDRRGAGIVAPEAAYSHDLRRDGRTGRLGPGRWPQPAHRRQWLIKPDVGRVAHGVPHRVDRLRALGNAVVPQVAEHIGRLIIKAAA